MKKILTSILTIGIVGTISYIGVTRAFFSDTETSTGNILQAGAIDLLIGNTSYYNGQAVSTSTWSLRDLTVEKFFNFTDLKPGDWGEDTIGVRVNDNDSWACARVSFPPNGDLENDVTEPEADLADTTITGELDQELNFAFWADDGDNVYEIGETGLITGPVSTVLPVGGTLPLAQPAGGLFGSTPLTGATTRYIGKYWCYGTLAPAPVAPSTTHSPTTVQGFTCNGSGVGNISQTDSLVGDISFYAEQSRNNTSFSCANVQWPTPVGVKVGAALASYSAPTSCNATVTGNQSIQAAEDLANPGDTICVDPTYNGTGDNTAIRIEKAGITLAATVRGVNLDVPVTLSASNVTVTGFDGVIGQAASVSEQAAFYVESDADLFEISFNTVTGGTGAAILTETGGALGGGLIANNELSGATQGIYTNPHTGVFTIEYNDIDNNVAGIAGLMGALVRFNEFQHTTAGSEAIGVDSTHDANPATVSFNNFLDGTKLNTYGSIAGDVMAENNFWGPNGGAAQTGGTDEVDFTPEAGSAFAHN